jgi:hypothetical protein
MKMRNNKILLIEYEVIKNNNIIIKIIIILLLSCCDESYNLTQSQYSHFLQSKYEQQLQTQQP